MSTSEFEDREHLLETLDGFRTGMLVTLSGDLDLQARPMAVAGRDGSILWFLTSLDTRKVVESMHTERVAVLFQSPMTYMSVSGRPEILDDPDKVEELWREVHRAWFPDGPREEGLVLLAVHCESADLWDLRGGRGLDLALTALGGMVRDQVRRFKETASADSEVHIEL